MVSIELKTEKNTTREWEITPQERVAHAHKEILIITKKYGVYLSIEDTLRIRAAEEEKD